MKKKLIQNSIVSFLLCLTLQVNSQNEFRIWYFGSLAGLDFSTSPPSSLINGVISSVEGCATISDNMGNLLFYTNGVSVANSQHALMANGSGLLGNGSSTQSSIIVKQPGNSNIYYIFTLGMLGAANSANYSIVDMTLAVGLGSVTVKNASLYTTNTCEKQVAVRHCNGKDVWVVSHEYGTNNFRAYLLTASGINTIPVISAIGETIAGNGTASAGHLKISPDGRKLAMATYTSSVPNSLGNGGFSLFDFDAASGVVSNSLILNSAPFAYGVEFSPDGTKLYGTTSITNGSYTATLFQWSICAATNSAIVSSQYSVGLGSLVAGAGSVQKAIDGKIYLALSGTQSLSVINNPNASGAAMGFSLNSLSLAPKNSGLGLPNYINPYTKPAPLPFTNTISCQKTNFAVPPVPTFTSGCNITPYAPNGYFWDFGEPSSGAANTSTMSNPVHTYSTTGTYTVSLILINPCVNDTIKQTVNIVTQGPTPAVSGPTLICKGDKYDYTASGGSSYLWSTNSTATTVLLSPTLTTVYTLSATLNGCTLSKTFTVTVNPCLGIGGPVAEPVEATSIRIFPNPVTNELNVESSIPSTIMIFDMNGSLVLESKLNSGSTKISTEQLKAGIYSIQINSASGIWRNRLVKMD